MVKDTQKCLVSFPMLVLKRLPVCLILGKELGEGGRESGKGRSPVFTWIGVPSVLGPEERGK